MTHLAMLLRGFALIFAGGDIIAIPFLVYKRTAMDRRRPIEASFVLGVEALLLGQIIVTANRWDSPSLAWFGAPLLLLASLLLAYAAWSFRRASLRRASITAPDKGVIE